MAILGYARTSTIEQNIEPQIKALTAAGCEKIFSEQKSGIDANRPELAKMMEYSREGDVITVTKLDRIGRSTSDVLNIVTTLKNKGVAFKCLNINFDSSTPTGELMLTMLAAVATFERGLMLERQRDGIEAAKRAGKYLGRKPTARAKTTQVFELLSQGKTRQETANALNIGVASVYRIARSAKISQ